MNRELVIQGLEAIIQGLQDEISSEMKTKEANNANEKTEGTEKKEAKVVTKEEEKIKLEDIRAVLAEKSQDGKTHDVKKLLESFGANKLSAVKEKDYTKLLVAAMEL